jgi:hypothetical protein
MKRRTTKKLMKRPRRPVSDFETEHGPLSDDERALLSDPRGITEDEDDLIIIRRREVGASFISLDEALTGWGFKRVRFHGRIHLVKSTRRAEQPRGS